MALSLVDETKEKEEADEEEEENGTRGALEASDEASGDD